MKALLRGFLTGFGFALGASVAGTLIGYGIGKIGEAGLKQLFSPEPTSNPSPSSSPGSSPTTDEEPEWHKGCTWCWRTNWHADPEPASEEFSCGHCDFRSPFRVQVMQHAAEAHKSHYVAAEEPCPAHFGSLQCSLSKGHTKPVDHWNGPTGTMFKVSVDEPEEEGDGGDYDKALDRHDNA